MTILGIHKYSMGEQTERVQQQQSLWSATLMRLQLLDFWMSCDGTKRLPPERKRSKKAKKKK